MFLYGMTAAPSPPDLAALAAFSERLRAADATFGDYVPISGKGTETEPYTFPWYRVSDLGTAFFNAMYETGWVMEGFDWITWKGTPEAQRFFKRNEAVVAADAEQLTKLITTVVRQDRYCDGTLEWAFSSGLLLAIAVRAEALLEEGAGQDGASRVGTAAE